MTATELDYIAYDMYINTCNNFNFTNYCTISFFIVLKKYENAKYYKKANNIIRKQKLYKIEKICK